MGAGVLAHGPKACLAATHASRTCSLLASANRPTTSDRSLELREAKVLEPCTSAPPMRLPKVLGVLPVDALVAVVVLSVVSMFSYQALDTRAKARPGRLHLPSSPWMVSRCARPSWSPVALGGTRTRAAVKLKPPGPARPTLCMSGRGVIVRRTFKPVPRGREGELMTDVPQAKKHVYKSTLMSDEEMGRALRRIAHEVIERNKGAASLAFVGIHTRGVPLAEALARLVAEFEGVTPPVGKLDITLYRDDLTEIALQPLVKRTEVDFDVHGKRIVLVDDVLYT